jgi:calcium permeable stress-gated cation channel
MIILLVTQGLTGAGGALLQAATLFMHYTRKWFFGRTPRQAYTVTFVMPSVCLTAKEKGSLAHKSTSLQADFGAVLAQMSLLATIGFAYSILSPIINGLATLAFALFYFAWKFRK